MYLSSCYFNEPELGPDIQHMNFSSLLEMIQGNHFSVELPPVLHRNLVRFRTKNGTLATVKREREAPPLKNVRKGERVVNKNPHPQLLLCRDENFNGILSPYLKVNGEDVPYSANSRVCLWFHCDGECTDDCSFAGTHGLLPPKVVNECVSFLTKARKAAGST